MKFSDKEADPEEVAMVLLPPPGGYRLLLKQSISYLYQRIVGYNTLRCCQGSRVEARPLSFLSTR